MAWEPDYVTATEFKDFARITDSVDDTTVARAITSASRSIDRFCSQHVPRQFGLTTGAEARYYTARWDTDQIRWVIEVDDIDLAQAAAVTVHIDTSNSDTYSTELTQFVLRPKNAPQKNRPYTQISVLPDESNQPWSRPDGVQVTARFGWTTVPTTIKEVTLLQALRYHKRRTAPFGVAGSPRRGTQVTTNLVEELDAEFETQLQPYVKLGWTV